LELVTVPHVTNSLTPNSRWDGKEMENGHVSAKYGTFVAWDTFSSDAAAFGIS